MTIRPCPRAHADRCCRTDCAAPAVHAGFTTARGRLVEHQRCAAHVDDLDPRRIRHLDPRWKAVNA